MRRNRGGVAAAGLVLAAVLIGTAGVAWQAREARIQRDVAKTQLARATAANEFTAFLLSVAAPGGGKFSVGELLEQGESLIDKQFAGDDALRAEMLITVGEEYMLSERYEKATPILERAAALAAGSKDPALHARALCPLALVKIIDNDRTGAETLIRQALDGLPDEPQYSLQRAECLLRRSEFGYFIDDAEAMIANASAAMALLERTGTATIPKRIDARSALAYGYYLSGQNGKAEQEYHLVMKELEQVGRERTLAAADTLNNWALVYFQGDIAKAEPLCRRVIELRRSIEGGESVAPTFSYNYAGVLFELARYPEAGAMLEESIRTAAAREEPRIRFDAMMQLADVYINTGDLPRAAAQLEKLTPFLGDPHFDKYRQAQMAYYRGHLAQARGDQASARAQFTAAVEIFKLSKSKIALNVPTLIGLARAEQALGDPTAALASAEGALALAKALVEKDSPSYLVGHSLAALGEIQRASGKTDEARATFQEAARHLRLTLGSDHPATKSAEKNASS